MKHDTCEQHEDSVKILVNEELPRPPATRRKIICAGCDKKITVELQWWRCMNDGCDGKWWVKDNMDSIPIHHLYCDTCNSK